MGPHSVAVWTSHSVGIVLAKSTDLESPPIGSWHLQSAKDSVPLPQIQKLFHTINAMHYAVDSRPFKFQTRLENQKGVSLILKYIFIPDWNKAKRAPVWANEYLFWEMIALKVQLSVCLWGRSWNRHIAVGFNCDTLRSNQIKSIFLWSFTIKLPHSNLN